MMPVEVTGHALRRSRDRRHWSCDELSDMELADAVIAEVRAALDAGRCAVKRPVWAVRWKEQPSRLPPDRVYVWDQGEDHCWIVERQDGRDVVVTSLQRVVAREAAA